MQEPKQEHGLFRYNQWQDHDVRCNTLLSSSEGSNTHTLGGDGDLCYIDARVEPEILMHTKFLEQVFRSTTMVHMIRCTWSTLRSNLLQTRTLLLDWM
jgi:hypothetical protein